jgi:hypothetical protein
VHEANTRINADNARNDKFFFIFPKLILFLYVMNQKNTHAKDMSQKSMGA